MIREIDWEILIGEAIFIGAWILFGVMALALCGVVYIIIGGV